ncbi:MAG TPA: sulfatase-like hydrolase/transferase [Acidimicrobiia bacterium]|jgi:arylsulfatase A-like enzyme
MNVLLVTLDQFRGDSLSAAGHPVVRTPHLDALAADGVRLARHYSQAAPCSPGRACLYTGTYQMNNRVVANGTPLDDRFDNVARAARRAGYDPVLFGYTDQGIDPRLADGPDDPRLSDYEGVLPGFSVALDLSHDRDWHASLAELGYGPFESRDHTLATEPDRPAEHSISAFTTDRLIEWLRRRDPPWFVHASYLRPHPPYAAAGEWSRAYDPDAVPLPVSPAARLHPFHEGALSIPLAAAPRDERGQREMRAQYYGMIGEVDHQLGRVWDALRELDQWDDTFVLVTSDHGEQLGDHGLVQKLGWFEASYHVLGIVRDPRHPEAHGGAVHEFTENVDVFPTLCEVMDVEIPAQCDGLPLTPFLRGETPEWWRDAAHWEFDWRDMALRTHEYPWPWDRRPERMHLAVRRDAATQYVQFGDGSWLCYDLATDPTGRTEICEPAVVLPLAQDMLAWRSEHADRTMTGMLLENGGIGRWPPTREHAS